MFRAAVFTIQTRKMIENDLKNGQPEVLGVAELELVVRKDRGVEGNLVARATLST